MIKYYFEDKNGKKLNFKLENLQKCKHDCISWSYIIRRIYKITDVFSRIITMALMWIIFEYGGYIVMCILFIEIIIIISIWSINGSYNRFTLLVGTYFAEITTKNNKNNSKFQTAAIAFIRRIEILIGIVICIIVVFFKYEYQFTEKYFYDRKNFG